MNENLKIPIYGTNLSLFFFLYNAAVDLQVLVL